VSKWIFLTVCVLAVLCGPIDRVDAMNENPPELIDLAGEKFGDLTDAERKMFEAAASGEIADCCGPTKEDNDPANAVNWPKARTIRAKCIEWLCTDSEASSLVTHKGVQVEGARIEGELNLRFAVMNFPLVFLKCAFEKEINLQYAQIQALHLGGTHTGPINADGLEVKSFAYLRNGFKAEGEVRFLNATIGGNLECDNSEFNNPRESALLMDSLNVKGSVFLREGFKAKGKVRLLGANIGGNLDCIKGEFVNPSGHALWADGLNVKGSVILRDDFKAKGTVRLTGATIGGNLDCSSDPDKETKGGELINPDGRALSADGLNVKGSVFLRYGFRADGKISLENAIINNMFVYTGVESPEKAVLSLRSAKIGVLWDEKKSWPKKGNLYLHGLVYDNLDDWAPKDAKSRIEWLRLNGGEEFSPQPYEQLASVLRNMGQDADAKKILIAKNKDRARWGPKLTWSEWFWYRVFGPMIGYGHQPWRAFLIGLVIIVFGTFLFHFGSENNLLAATKDAENASSAKFHALVYSIDMFVPLVDLYQAKYWLPDTNQKAEWRPFNLSWFKMPVSGSGLRWYLWFHISIGWILTTLLVVGLTGLVRT
jgi:sRNA-binding regulator protein Hfq